MNILMYLQRQPERLAALLNRRTQYWNRTSKLIALALFCLLFGGLSLYLFLKSI